MRKTIQELTSLKDSRATCCLIMILSDASELAETKKTDLAFLVVFLRHLTVGHGWNVRFVYSCSSKALTNCTHTTCVTDKSSYPLLSTRHIHVHLYTASLSFTEFTCLCLHMYFSLMLA